ncbi:MAG: efflux RND transporter periplasmic adaptor subunit [Denitrovibrio sp.]|nr:MAG: efflux RND transporter periplasmic adaptor subunit [Denitrovibrio sp.]
MLRKVLTLVFTFAFLAACGSEDKVTETVDTPKNVTVKTMKVERTDTASSRSFTATVSSEKTAFIIPKVVGYVEQILVSPGQKVQAGQLLAVIKSGELEEKYAFAQSSVKEAENGLKQSEIGYKMAEAQHKQAQSQYDLAEKTYNRFSNLIKNNSVSRQEFDQVEANYDLAKQSLKISEENVSLASEKVEQVKLKKQQATSMLNEVKTYLSYTKIKAPFDGVVLEKNMDAGNLAAPGSPMMKIGNTDTVIYTYISQSLIKDISTGTKAMVTIESLGEDYESEVLEVSPDVDVFTGSFKVKLMGCQKIFPGMFAKVRFITGSEKLISIPESALVRRGQLNIVFINDNGKADMRIVKTGRELGGVIEILSGLEEGDIIVVENAKLLKSGDILEAK